MTLLDRIAANRCAVVDCDNDRHPDAKVCRDDLGELWMRRLDPRPDGTYVRRRALRARDESGLLRAT